jgi:hypothetical protein
MKIDWERRELCSDGACIGVIGDDGLCMTCGRVAANLGNDRLRGLAAEPADEPDEPEDDHDVEDDEPAPAEGGDDWDQRQLCSNGACVGVIGENGVCTVCGSPRA